MKKTIVIDNNEFEVDLRKLTQQYIEFEYKGHTYKYQTLHRERNFAVLQNSGELLRVNSFIADKNNNKQLFVNEKEALIKVLPKVEGKSAGGALTEGSLQSPMPGKIFKVVAEVGQEISKGDPVLIVEAMKMEHTIRATKEGIIKEIFFKEGDQVQGGVLLCEIE